MSIKMEWKWTKGEPFERTPRQKKSQSNEFIQNDNFSKEIEDSAYSTSLNHDENTWDILNQSVLYNSSDISLDYGFKQTNKREILDSKIADRELVQQRGANPFLNETNYVQDISVSDMFLKPVNTTQERAKPLNNYE